MLSFPYPLAEIDSKVLETNEHRRVWFLGDPALGAEVDDEGRLDELAGSCYFVVPELDAEEGPLSILTVARGRPWNAGETPAPEDADETPAPQEADETPAPEDADETPAPHDAGETPAPHDAGEAPAPHGADEAPAPQDGADEAPVPMRTPSIWDPVDLAAELGGVYACVTYYPSRSEFEVAMNVGSESKELLGVILEGAPPELVCGRVLELYFEISEERIFASIHNRFMNGDVSLDGVAPSTGKSKTPWGVPASGHWWVMVGVDGREDRALPLPPGFGLSNLRLTLGADHEEAMGSMLYDGALDHLVADPPQRLTEEDLELFTEHVKTLRRITADVERIRLLLPISQKCRADVSPAL